MARRGRTALRSPAYAWHAVVARRFSLLTSEPTPSCCLNVEISHQIYILVKELGEMEGSILKDEAGEVEGGVEGEVEGEEEIEANGV